MKNFSAGIHVLVKKNNKYLILKRSEKDVSDPGCWDLPGGGVDFGEQPLVAAVRETAEEAGLKVKITKLLTLTALSNKETPGQESWSIESIALGEYLAGEVKLSPEHTTHRWVSKQELLDIEPKGTHLQTLAKHFREN